MNDKLIPVEKAMLHLFSNSSIKMENYNDDKRPKKLETITNKYE